MTFRCDSRGAFAGDVVESVQIPQAVSSGVVRRYHVSKVTRSRPVEDAMTPERWDRIQTLFYAVRTRPEGQRAQFLADGCGGDTVLESEVQALLDQPVSTSGF